jgi:short-subunit dehydrogenase
MSKTAVITGATSGIGAAYAKRLAADGYNLVITGRKKETIQKLADDLAKKHNVKVDVIIAELSNDAELQKLIDVVKARDDIEILINNAGYSGYLKHFNEVDIAEHEKMVKVHQIVPMRLISLVVPGMIKRGRGDIINVASIGAFMPIPTGTVYCGTKAFLKIYSQSLYYELKDKGIRVQVLCPGGTSTNFSKDYWSKEEYEQMMSKGKRMIGTSEMVVDYSLKSLKKNKIVCIPGMMNRVMSRFFPMLPKGMYYGLLTRMTNFK